MRLILPVLFLAATAGAQVPSGYYNAAAGKTGTALQTALHGIINNQTPLTYGTSASSGTTWVAFKTTDVKPNGKIWDIYSDKPGSTPAYEYTPGTKQCGNGTNSENSCYNHEHVWPQSKFGSASPMKSDLWIVYPTDYYVNGQRGDLPYGKVGTAAKTFTNGSKLGSQSTTGAPSGNCFEPIDSFKGDIARSYFYIATRYLGEDASWDSWEMATKAVLNPWAVQMLLQWHRMDPVSAKEIARNNAVYAAQGNRNPFIDSPRYVECIWGGQNCTTSNPPPSSGVATASFTALQVQLGPGGLTVDWSGLPAGTVQSVALYDLQGRVLERRMASGTTLQLSTSGYAPGLYVIQARGASGVIGVGKALLP